MALYQNKTKDAAISSVEFTPALDGNFSFIRVRDKAHLDAARKQVQALGDNIVAETLVEGAPMLVAHGPRTDYTIVNELNKQGNVFEKEHLKRKTNAWKLRGWASMIGQPLQLVSAYLKPKGIDSATASFATLNIIANVANITVGEERVKDVHQLRYLKRKFNTELAQYLPEGASSQLPSSYDDRTALRQGKEAHPSLGKRCMGFIKHHSVSFCEVGLRYLGSIFLAFPLDKWREGSKAFGASLKERDDEKLAAAVTKYRTSNNIEVSKELDAKTLASIKKDTRFTGGLTKALWRGVKATYNHADPATGIVGLGYIAGKTLALTSKVEDPYDPKPHTWLDTVREKYTFKASSIIEAVAAGYLSYDRLFKKKLSYVKVANLIEPAVRELKNIKKGEASPAWLEKMRTPLIEAEKPNNYNRDWFGGIGGALFTLGLGIRVFAKYGHKELDINELNAHMTDGLAQVPQDKVPQLIANYSAFLTEHMKGKITFGQTYKQLTDDLYRYHQIALPVDSTKGDAKAPGQDAATLTDATIAKAAASASPEREADAARIANAAIEKASQPSIPLFAQAVAKKDLSPAAMPRPASHQDALAANAANGLAMGV